MATKVQTEQVYGGNQSAGVAVLVAFGMLSLVSVLGMFVVLGMSVIRSRRSSDPTLFVRTHVAIFFFSLLICDFIQGIGALLNIPWIVEKRAYVGPTCTAQATIKQIGNVGTAIFSFVIASHTFSLLFLRRQWSTRTCYIVLVASWLVILFDLCIGNFAIADPKRRGPYYGISGYWCWITPAYPVERYTTEYLFMFASAGFSFILYLLVFFKLRGNITLSDGYKIHFQRRPKVRVGRTATGTYIMTDDRRVESHLTTVAKQMLWYPIAYTVLVLPIAAARFSVFAGASVPFEVTIFTASVFMLTGFVNAVLFCLTRNVLPGTWRQKFGIGSTFDSRRGNGGVASRTNQTWRSAASNARVGTGATPVGLNIGVEKNIEIKYDDDESGPAFLKAGSPPSPSSPLKVHDGTVQHADPYDHRIKRLSFSVPRASRGDHAAVDRSHNPDGVHRVGNASTAEWEVPQHSGHAPSRHEGVPYGPAPGLEAPTSFHPYATATPVNTATRQPRPSSILIIENVNHGHPRWVRNGSSGGNGGGTHWTGSNQ